jgi:hypothetical protein
MMDAQENSLKQLTKTGSINNNIERQGWSHNQTDDFPSKMASNDSFKFDKSTLVIE